MKDEPVLIGRYLVKRELGRGAMGAIYKAHDPDIDRPVAIKLVRADLLESADRDHFLARFRREAQAAARCAHPNIVAIYDFALHEGNPYLAMEYVDGVTLGQARPFDGKFAVEDALFLVLQVLDALQAAHASGIVHRDIKPANIMLVGGTRVKVADFGIARMDTSTLTQTEAVIGTPSYMSPEQCNGQIVDARSDLFSVGIVLFEMLAGKRPFTGSNSTAVLTRLLRDPAPDLREFVPSMPAEVCAVVARSLAKHPADRYASASEMANALRSASATKNVVHDERTLVETFRFAVSDTAPTVVQTPTSASFDPRLIDTLSRKLAELLGPMGPFLVQSEARKATSVEALCAALESQVEHAADRLAFQQEVRRQIGRADNTLASKGTLQAASPAAAQSTVGVALSPAEMERLKAALARHMGPMALVLIKRELPKAASHGALWEALSAHINDAAEQQVFLSTRPRI
jgi:serine/threonine-protein kinase